MSLTTWVDARIKAAVDEANKDLKADVQAMILELRRHLRIGGTTRNSHDYSDDVDRRPHTPLTKHPTKGNHR